MKNHMLLLVGFTWLLCSCLAVQGQTSNSPDIQWQQGPSIGDLGGKAQVRIPAGYLFANASETRKAMEAMENPPSGEEVGLVAPESLDWYVIFEYEDVGYVRDDEKSSLDADAMLKTIKKGTDAGNEERRKRGWSPVSIIGWEQMPRYDEATHNLEWAIRGECDGELTINHNTRLLGRSGVMRVTFVTDPKLLASTLPKYRGVLAGFTFVQGQKYSEFRQGDKVAKYGLTALVVGGASAVAVKSGLFKWIWKLLVIAFLGAMGFLKKLFSRKQSE